MFTQVRNKSHCVSRASTLTKRVREAQNGEAMARYSLTGKSKEDASHKPARE